MSDLLLANTPNVMASPSVCVHHSHEVLNHHKGQRLLRRGYLVADPEVLRLIEQNEEVRRDVNALPCQMGQS